jgi:hypothetical protein
MATQRIASACANLKLQINWTGTQPFFVIMVTMPTIFKNLSLDALLLTYLRSKLMD